MMARMDVTPFVDRIRRELAAAADASGDDARAIVDRLTGPLESAMRLAMLEALSAAALEITRELAPGSVHVRLNGLDPDFVVTPAPSEPSPAPAVAPATPPAGDDVPGERGGPTSRINLRLPDDVKARVEDAAAHERISVNAWLVRAAVAGLEPRSVSPALGRAASGGQRFTGWAR